MIDSTRFASFVIASTVVMLMPGPAMLFAMANGITRGQRTSKGQPANHALEAQKIRRSIFWQGPSSIGGVQ